MKVHRLGNDYAQRIRFQNKEKTHAGNASKPKVGKTGGEKVEAPKEEKGAGGVENKEGRQEKQDKKEKNEGKAKKEK